MDVTSLRVDMRVELHPATDQWMQGDMYGKVELIGPRGVLVLLDKSKRRIWFQPDNILKEV